MPGVTGASSPRESQNCPGRLVILILILQAGNLSAPGRICMPMDDVPDEPNVQLIASWGVWMPYRPSEFKSSAR